VRAHNGARRALGRHSRTRTSPNYRNDNALTLNYKPVRPPAPLPPPTPLTPLPLLSPLTPLIELNLDTNP